MIFLCLKLGILLFLLALFFCFIRVQLMLQLSDEKHRSLLDIKIVIAINKLSKEFNFKQEELNLIDIFSAFKSELKTYNSKKQPDYPGEKGLVFLRLFSHKLKSIKNYKSIFPVIYRYLLIEKLEWRTVIGLSDAMNTALASGSIWALKGVALSHLSSKSRLLKPQINVQPDFSSKIFLSNMICILKMRIVHIIIIGIYILVLTAKNHCKLSIHRN